MRWYHFTGPSELQSILLEGALLSWYEKLREKMLKGGFSKDKVDAVFELYQKLLNSREYERKSYVYLTPDKENPREASRKDIRLEFELDTQPNKGSILILPKVSLDHLVKIDSIPMYVSRIKKALKKEHGGKYIDVPVGKI